MLRHITLIILALALLWPLNLAIDSLEKRSATLEKLELIVQANLQKHLQRLKDQFTDPRENERISESIVQKKWNTLSSTLNGKIKAPDYEFFAMLHLAPCQFYAKTPAHIDESLLCRMSQNNSLILQELETNNSKSIWVFQKFPITHDTAWLAGVKLDLPWLLASHSSDPHQYDLQLSLSADHDLNPGRFAAIDPGLKNLTLKIQDNYASIEKHLPFITVKNLRGLQLLLFICPLIILFILSSRLNKDHVEQHKKLDIFHNFLKRDLGINFNKEVSADYLDLWLNSLKEYDIEARKMRKQLEKDIEELKNQLHKKSIAYHKLESSTASLQRYRNISRHLQRFEESIQQFKNQFFKSDSFIFSDAMRQAHHNNQKLWAILARWQAGCEELSPRRFLRKLYETEALSTEGGNKLESELQQMQLNATSLREFLHQAALETHATTTALAQIHRNWNLILDAAHSFEGTEFIHINASELFKSVEDILSQNVQDAIHLRHRSVTDFSFALDKGMVLPLAMSIYHLIQLGSNRISNNAKDISVQFKHRKSDQTHYLVTLLKVIKRDTSPLSTKAQSNINMTSDFIGMIEELLQPLRILPQVLELTTNQIVVSFSWKEQTSASIASLEAFSANESGEFELPPG